MRTGRKTISHPVVGPVWFLSPSNVSLLQIALTKTLLFLYSFAFPSATELHFLDCKFKVKDYFFLQKYKVLKSVNLLQRKEQRSL